MDLHNPHLTDLPLASGRSGSSTAIDSAVDLALRSMGEGREAIPQSVRSSLLRLGVLSGNASVFKLVKECYLSTKDGACLIALAACPPSDECLELTLDHAFPREDSGRFLFEVAQQGGERFQAVWSWLIDKGGIDKLVKQWGPVKPGDQSLESSGVTYSLSRYLTRMVRLVMDEVLLEKIEVFAKTYSTILDPDFLTAARQSFDLNQAYIKRGKSDCEWLDPSTKHDDR
jgi:hypothetical protein